MASAMNRKTCGCKRKSAQNGSSPSVSAPEGGDPTCAISAPTAADTVAMTEGLDEELSGDGERDAPSETRIATSFVRWQRGEQQVRHVRAGDEEHQPDRAEHRVQQRVDA